MTEGDEPPQMRGVAESTPRESTSTRRRRRMGPALGTFRAPPLESLLLVGFFLGVTSIITGRILFATGTIAGGDWSIPITPLQLNSYSRGGLFLWTHSFNVFGVTQPFLATPVHAAFYAASRFLDGPALSRALLLCVYVLTGLSIFRYARFIRLGRAAALLAATLFLVTPVFFNYTAMGWGLVLLAFSLTPWMLSLFTRSVKTGQMLPALFAALLLALGFSLASQAAVWYPLAVAILMPFIIRSRRELWRAIRTGLLCAFIFALLNLAWLLPLIQYGDPLLSSAASETDVPLGQRLGVLNILRGWGSLFNWPFETAYPDSLLILSVVQPMVGYAALLMRPRDWRAQFAAILTVVPLLFYLLPDTFYDLPFTGVIRDVSRFILFQALGSSLLAGLALDRLLARPRATQDAPSVLIARVQAAALATVLLAGGYPAWAGELTAPSTGGSDIRLRTLRPPDDFATVESHLAQGPTSHKALHFPTGIFLNQSTDSRFRGIFQEFIDSHAAFAPYGGGIFVGDRRAGEYRAVAKLINSPRFLGLRSPSEFLGALGVRWLVVRPDLEGDAYRTADLIRRLESDDGFVLHRYDNLLLYTNVRALPRVYASTSPVLANEAPDQGMSDAFVDGFTDSRKVAFFAGSSYDRNNGRLIAVIRDVASHRPSVAFQRINPTRFDIRIDNIKGPFFLVLAETFDPRWKLTQRPSGLPPANRGDRELPPRYDFVWSDASIGARPTLHEASHFVANGYANAWYIEPPQGTTSMEFRAHYAPQAIAYVGFAVAGITTVGLFALIAVLRTKPIRTQRRGWRPSRSRLEVPPR